MLPEFLKLINLGDKLSKLSLIKGRRLTDASLDAVGVAKVSDGAKLHIMAALPSFKLIVTADGLGARSIAQKLSRYPGLRVRYLPYRDDVLIPRKGFSVSGVRERVCALAGIVFGETDVLVTAADSLLQLFPAKRLIKKYSRVFCAGDTLSPIEAANDLAISGYIRRDMISEAGEFALRGDILDVFSVDGKAYRINFFDENIEDIRLIDPESMLKISETDKIIIPPTSDILLDPEDLKNTVGRLSPHLFNRYAADLTGMLREGACNPSAVWGLPFMEGAASSLSDYFDDMPEALLILDEPKVIAEKFEVLQKEFKGRLKTLAEGGEALEDHASVMLGVSEVRRKILTMRKLAFSGLTASNPLFQPKLLIEPKTRPVTKYYLDPAGITQDLNNFILNGFKTMLAAGSPERARGILETLREEGVYAEYSEDGNGAASVLVTPLSIDYGFIYPQLKVCVIGVSECVGRRHKEEAVSLKTQFIAPKAGDYVVHRVHGVGICEGTTILRSGEFDKEYIVLRYRDGDMLYVAVDQMDNLQKFVGEENPKLNKLGGREFEREKEKARSSVRRLAIDLLELYAERERSRGFKYSEDTIWQQEFEDAFEYEETADQLKAIEAVKEDMEKGRIMDRLLVGDVGFGKTEVAFRAMFKTAMDSKQAILLAPTTILARQHYENLKARLEPFGMECGLLSRLQSAAENAETLSRLEDGTLLMVIATHKVLSKSVRFHDPGLLVLDEEQRFGVEHKEKLKERYPGINVLTLSATPIPRTLNMALSGVRDISLLETAPIGRLPVQTYVTEYSDALCADAIEREIARGGQTLIICNDIDALDAFAQKLRKLTGGGARIITAHGQMPPGLLEQRISAFYEKSFDVLIATTIIENGIDLPDANTLLVVDSGKFGLSQLYQLRGRVGRRGALAHAYFTLPQNGALTSDAEKRLRALLDNTEIGSGFRIALSDLSIRGAGTLLGAEQHGHIERVGYEMYVELLNEAVDELKTGRVRSEEREVEIKIDAPAYIREGYVGGRDKLRVYKQISAVSASSARDRLISELTDVYGRVEQPLKNLIDISLLKNLAKLRGVSKITISKGGTGVNFYDESVFKNEAVMRAAAAHSDSVVLTSSIPPSLIFDVKNLTAEQKIEKLLEFFESMEN